MHLCKTSPAGLRVRGDGSGCGHLTGEPRRCRRDRGHAAEDGMLQLRAQREEKQRQHDTSGTQQGSRVHPGPWRAPAPGTGHGNSPGAATQRALAVTHGPARRGVLPH